eukprot:TRINITY_DN5849_c0_g1_i1.p1 TRINITY_DN5849_c0_g1~~TRINITY_DN5849_c0_g1_i1.p1  ORF type:complete len:234 (+),score=23.74 TRINITY_DN5849_c0_g1_i1:76-777(+)
MPPFSSHPHMLGPPGVPLLWDVMAESAAAESAAAAAYTRLKLQESILASAIADRTDMFHCVSKWQSEPPPLATAWEHRLAYRRAEPGITPAAPVSGPLYRWEHLPSCVLSPRQRAKTGVFVASASAPSPRPGDDARRAAESFRAHCDTAQHTWEALRSPASPVPGPIITSPHATGSRLAAAYAQLDLLRVQHTKHSVHGSRPLTSPVAASPLRVRTRVEVAKPATAVLKSPER